MVISAEPVVLADNAVSVLESRYLSRNEQGDITETPEDLFHRVSNNLAKAERFYGGNDRRVHEVAEQFYQLMTSLDFLPNSPTLFNAGRSLQQLSACFVLPVPDSIEGIFETVKHTAMIHQSGGGTGFSFSRLRPEGSIVKTTTGVASGPVSFMKVFDAATEAIKQGGKRRGANMGILVVDHPDIEKFIDLKSDMTTLTNFNISVALTAKFMQAVEDDTDYDLYDPNEKKVVGQKRARDVWQRILQNAWKNGDPGLVFIDRWNESNPVPQQGPIESSNPCGEQALGPYDACNLGSINVAHFVRHKSNGPQIEWEEFGKAIALSVRLLDNVVDMSVFPIPEIANRVAENRRIGLGIMGFADMLVELGVPYNSPDALTWAERISSFLKARANTASIELAKERGVFPAWEGSIYGENERYRNAARTTIAPTGSISIIANCSSGIEPLFSLAFTRQHYLDRENASVPTQMTEVNESFLRAAQERGFYSDDLIQYLAHGGNLADRDEVPADIKTLFVTAHDVDPEWHVRVQAAFQRHIDNGVSKTINFSHDATPDDVEKAYLLAYHEGCKGITIYRDGSRDLQVLTHLPEERQLMVIEPTSAGPVRKRLPQERDSKTHKFVVGDFEGYLTVGLYEDGTPGEVFIKVSKQGSTVNGLMDTVAQLTSIALQYGVPLDAFASNLKGSRFEPSGFTNHEDIRTVTSLTDYLFRYLENKFLDVSPIIDYKCSDTDAVQTGMGCPECGSLLNFAEGCLLCRSCGYSKCG